MPPRPAGERHSCARDAYGDTADGLRDARGAATDARCEDTRSAARLTVGRLAVPVDHSVTDPQTLAATASVSAFTAAMRRARPGFTLDDAAGADVADICAAVHGVPSQLAFAARMAAAEGIDAVAHTLARTGWDDGLDALTALVGRHADRTAVTEPADPIEHAVHAGRAEPARRAGGAGLDASRRRVLTAASLSPYGLGAEALHQVTGLPDVADVLARLADDGLIEVLEECSGTMGRAAARRYHLPLPALAAVRPDVAGRRALGGAHSDYFLRLAQAHAGRMWTSRQPGALLALRRERRNIAAALRWAVDNGRSDRALAVVTALAPYWRRTAELPTLHWWVVELFGRLGASSLAETHRVNVLAAEVFARLGEHEAALDAIEAAERAAGKARIGEAAAADQVLATGLALHATSAPRAAEQMRHAVERYRAIGDDAAATSAAFDLCAVEFGLGRARDADRTARAALACATRRGDELTAAALLLRLAAFTAAGGGPHEPAGATAAGASSPYVERAMVKVRGLGAAAAVGVLACQVDAFFEPSVVRRATDLARLLGSFTAHHRADFHDAYPDFAVGDLERRLRVVLGDRALGEAAASGAGVPLHEVFARVAASALGTAAKHAAAPRTDPLTRRETEVALLVGEGLTNREVARKLSISEWTVVNHMRQIMRKLGLTSRVQLARWVTAKL